jgi:hypothetical protein
VCHCRAGPVEAPLLQKCQNGAVSAAESEMCRMVCAMSGCGKGAAGVQACVVFRISPLRYVNSLTKISMKIGVVMGTHCLASQFTRPESSRLFCWGYIKNRTYAQHPRDIRDLMDKIVAAFEQITPQMLDKAWKHMTARYLLCCERQGGHVEAH